MGSPSSACAGPGTPVPCRRPAQQPGPSMTSAGGTGGEPGSWQRNETQWRSRLFHVSARIWLCPSVMGYVRAFPSLLLRPLASLHPSLPSRVGCGGSVGGSLHIQFWVRIVGPYSSVVVVGRIVCVGLWKFNARSLSPFPAIPRPVEPKPQLRFVLFFYP